MIFSICSYIESLDWEYLQTVLLICFAVGIFNWHLAFIMFIVLILPTSPLCSSGAEVTPTAQSGKYILEEVDTPTGAPADAPEPAVSSPPPSPSQVEVVRFGRKAQAVMVVHEERPDLERSDSLQEDQSTPPASIQSVEETVDEQKPEIVEKETVEQVEPDTIEGPSEPEYSLEKNNALQIDPETNEALIDGLASTGAEDNGSLPPIPQTSNIYNFTSGTHDIGSAVNSRNNKRTDITVIESAAPLITRIRATAQKSKAPRRVKPSPFKHRCQCLKERRAEKVLIRHSKMVNAKGIQDRAYQQAVADCIVEAQGRMIGVEMDERAQAGQSTVTAISQPAMVDSAVAVDDHMDGVEVQGPVVDGAREVEMTDAPPDDVVDELMIGSDIDGEMEVDSDEESVVNDGGPMDVDVDVDVSNDRQNLKASHANPVTNAGQSAPMIIASLSSSMDIDPQSTVGKVNKERLQDKIRREKVELALRNAFSSKEVASGSSSASAQWSQQHAAPATMSQTGIAAISMPAKIPQSMPSTNSASELKEVRQGKRADARVVPAPVTSQPISIPAPIIAPSPATKDKEAVPNKEDGYTSDTTSSTNTPTSTLPSSTSTTAPSSPLPPQASPASKDVPEMAVKRKLPVNSTKAGNGETQQEKPSPAPRPAEDSPPAESSMKKARSKPPPPKTHAAPEDDEVAPLSSIPDDRGCK